MRVEYPGAIYHVMDRGDRREDIFVDDVDRQDFLKILAEACQKTGWQVHAYPWSSLVWYLAAPEHRPGWIRVDRLLGEHGIRADTAAGREEFERHMETRRLEEDDEASQKVFRRGWCLGSEGFRKQMLELMEGNLGENHAGQLHRETAEEKAHRIIAQELARLGWEDHDLACRLKNDQGKLAIAARLRKETTLPLKWIAARLQMGTSKSSRSLLHQWMHHHDKPPCTQLQFQPMV
jgi:hypothetical protein